MWSRQREVTAAQTVKEQWKCLLQKCEPNNALWEGFLALKNVICGLMITRYSTGISSQTIRKYRKSINRIILLRGYPLSDLETAHSALSKIERLVTEVGGLSVLPCMSLMTAFQGWVLVKRELAWKQNSIGRTLPLELLYTFCLKTKILSLCRMLN